MCLHRKKWPLSRIRTAWFPRVVYKSVWFDQKTNQTKSEFRNFIYEKGKQYYANLGIEQLGYGLIVEEGLHAYTKHRKYPEIIKMVIPRGAKFIIGEHDEIVSTELYWPLKVPSFFQRLLGKKEGSLDLDPNS